MVKYNCAFVLEDKRQFMAGEDLEELKEEEIDKQASSDWLLVMLTRAISPHRTEQNFQKVLKILLGSLKLDLVKMDHYIQFLMWVLRINHIHCLHSK